jgi:hypothetical protein
VAEPSPTSSRRTRDRAHLATRERTLSPRASVIPHVRSTAWCLGRTCIGGRAGIVEATPVDSSGAHEVQIDAAAQPSHLTEPAKHSHTAPNSRDGTKRPSSPLKEAVCNSALPSSATSSTFAHAWGLDTKASALFQAGGLVTRSSLPGGRSGAPCGPLAVPRAGNRQEQPTVSLSVCAVFPRVPGCSRTTNVSGSKVQDGFPEPYSAVCGHFAVTQTGTMPSTAFAQ